MKFTKIALACALATAAISAQAASVPVPAGAKTVFLSGASAPDGFLADVATTMIESTIGAGDAPVGARTGAVNASKFNFRAFVGYSRVTGQAGQPVVFVKRSAGGSAFGVNPMAKAQRVETIDLANCDLNPTTADDYPTYTYVNCGTKGIDPGVTGYTNDASNPGEIPDIGVSDVEPALFQSPFNVENNQPALTPSELAVLSNNPVNVQMFGIVTTDAVPDTYNISRAEYGNMLAGKLPVWLRDNFAPVVVCRRVNGSGTQATYNWFFSGFPCNTSTLGYANVAPANQDASFGFDGNHAGTDADPFIIDPTAGYTVVENSGSSGVRACLKAAQDGTDFTATGSFGNKTKVLFSNVGGPSKAIGVLTVDSYSKIAADDQGWNFRMLDGAGKYYPAGGATDANGVDLGVCRSASCTGIAPNKANLMNGSYDFAVELSMQVRNTTVNGVPALNTDAFKNAFYNELVANAGSTKYTGNSTGTVFNKSAQAYATLPTVDSNTANPAYVSFYTRNGNTCQPLAFTLN